LNYFDIPKSQQGIARNRGVEKAMAPLTLFIGDDMFLAPDACEIHVATHERLAVSGKRLEKQNDPLAASRYPLAATLGHVTWDPSLDITPAMRWLEQTGWQFGYPMIEQYAGTFVPSDIQHRFTYTSHISLPTEVAKKIPFREDVSLYGWEDILWGMKLRDAGVRLKYEPSARVLHHHRLTMEDSLKRMETLGRSAVLITQLDPSLDRLPRGLKKIAYHLLSLVPTMRGRHAKAFMKGIRSASV
jgi:hypothetical protein